jgi:GntR family transcriptional regulator
MALGDVPKYQSISSDLRSRIAHAEFEPGDQLPSQHSMADEYGVTVMTLRQAIAQLENEGVVYASKGKGTFVSERPSVPYDLDHLSSFVQQMTRAGVEVSTSMLAIRFDSAPEVAAEARTALGLADGVAVVEIERLRSIHDQPVVLQRSFLAATTWGRVADTDLAVASLYDALAARCGLVLDRASEIIRAVGLGTQDAAILGVTVGRPSLESIRISRTSEDQAFLYDRALMSGTATEIRTERTAHGMSVAYTAVSS